MNEEDIRHEKRKRDLARWAIKNVTEGRYVYTVGPFEEVYWMLVALEGEGVEYKLLAYEDGVGSYYELHPYDGSAAMTKAKEVKT